MGASSKLISLSLILVGLERIKEWQCSFPYLDSVLNNNENAVRIKYNKIMLLHNFCHDLDGSVHKKMLQL